MISYILKGVNTKCINIELVLLYQHIFKTNRRCRFVSLDHWRIFSHKNVFNEDVLFLYLITFLDKYKWSDALVSRKFFLG